jgi:hypothetical protein
MGLKWNAYRAMFGKPGGRRPLGRPRCMRIILKWIEK